MMQVLRDKAQGWIAWVIVGLVGITFVLFGAGSLFDRDHRNQVVATVNGNKITGSELDNVYQRFMQQNGSQLQNVDSNDVKKELLDSLIQQKTILQATEHLGMTVSQQRVFSTLGSLPFLQVDNQFSEDSYLQFLNKNHFTDIQFRTLLRDALLREQLQQSIIPTSFVLSNDLQDLAKYMLQKRDFRFVVINKEPFEKAAKVTDEDIKQYYEKHLKDFMTEEALSLEYVHLSLPELIKSVQATDQEVQQFYQENSGSFSEPPSVHVAHILINVPRNADAKALNEAQAKLATVQKRLKEGASFEDLAKEFSDDKESAAQGGDLSWLNPGEMFPEFERVAFSLDKANPISEPLRSQYGFHIIKLLDRKNEKVKPFNEVKAQAALQYKRQQAEEQFVNMADELGTIAYDNPDSLQKAHDKLKLSIHKTATFTKAQGSKDPLMQNPQVFTAIWSTQVKDNKNNSDLIKLDDENYVVVRVDEYLPSKQKSLEDSQAKIKDILIAKMAEEKVKEKANTVLAELEKADPNKIAQVMSDHDLRWEERQNIERNTKEPIDPMVIQEVFTLPRPNDKEPRIKSVPLANGDYAIVWLTEVRDGEPSSLSVTDKEAYQAQLSKHMGELEFAMYASYLYKEAKIDIK
ncbi:MAG: SurA N-terminal domain-containing protein [Candidatus Berkiella sp.]